MIEYQERLERIYAQYQIIYRLLDEKLSKQTAPFIATYDKEIETLRKTYLKNIHAIQNKEDRELLFQVLTKEENNRYFKLLDDCSPFVQEADKKLKQLNKKLQIIQEHVLKGGKLIDE